MNFEIQLYLQSGVGLVTHVHKNSRKVRMKPISIESSKAHFATHHETCLINQFSLPYVSHIEYLKGRV